MSDIHQFHPQTLMWAGEVVKGSIEDDSLAYLLPVFAEAPTFSDQRRSWRCVAKWLAAASFLAMLLASAWFCVGVWAGRSVLR